MSVLEIRTQLQIPKLYTATLIIARRICCSNVKDVPVKWPQQWQALPRGKPTCLDTVRTYDSVAEFQQPARQKLEMKIVIGYRHDNDDEQQISAARSPYCW